ncbi:TPA: restriction endonuclease subunit S, partial [Vibrio cholerae]|nr:restriction endonuclease subunit S [Vibrio cholerae]
MSWPLVKLDSVVEVLSGFAFKSSSFNKASQGVPIIRIQNVAENNSEEDFVYWDESYKEKFLIDDGDILLSLSGNIKLGIWGNGKALLNQRIIKISEKEGLDKGYLFYFLMSAVKSIAALGKEAVISNVSVNDFKALLIPLPPLETQKKIAAVLEKADQLRQDCKLLEQELNSLAQSVFIDMFGDPVTNPKGWEVKTLDDVCDDIYRYPTFYGFDYVDKGIPVVKIGNITADGYVDGDLSKYDFMPESISKEYPRTILKLGDIVMAVRGDGSTGKRIGLVESESVVNGNISPNLIMYRANLEKVDYIFLYFFLTSFGGQKKIEKYIS